ncbi:hypothetical protein M0804_011473 [Polistes exclamans]|nr:hypothetical protein M0804_011473 [Polistes exclamans]
MLPNFPCETYIVRWVCLSMANTVVIVPVIVIVVVVVVVVENRTLIKLRAINLLEKVFRGMGNIVSAAESHQKKRNGGRDVKMRKTRDSGPDPDPSPIYRFLLKRESVWVKTIGILEN